jgi:hypothetical protein
MKLFFALLLSLLLLQTTNAQDDLLDEIDAEVTVSTKVSSVFKGLKIVNLESTKTIDKGDFYFVIAHRFGSVKGGFKNLFGLDQSNIRFSFLYGFSDRLTAGLSRSSYEKTYDFTTKYKLITQDREGFPLNIALFGAMAYKTIDPAFGYVRYKDIHRLNYVGQLLISRKINTNLSLQVTPMFLHENFVVQDTQENSQYAAGFGGRYKLDARFSINFDYVHHLNRATENPFVNPLSIGCDIETGGHVFQVHFSNSRHMNDAGFVNANGDWATGDIFFGFNLLRVF